MFEVGGALGGGNGLALPPPPRGALRSVTALLRAVMVVSSPPDHRVAPSASSVPRGGRGGGSGCSRLPGALRMEGHGKHPSVPPINLRRRRRRPYHLKKSKSKKEKRRGHADKRTICINNE